MAPIPSIEGTANIPEDPHIVNIIDGWAAIGAFARFCSGKTSQTGGRHALRDFDPF